MLFFFARLIAREKQQLQVIILCILASFHYLSFTNIILTIFQRKQQTTLFPSDSIIMVNYYCAARHLCGMNNPITTSVSPQHHCLECKKSMCGSLCGQLISEQSEECIIPIENLSEEGQRLFDSPSAVICHICIKKCSIENSKLPAKVSGDSESAVSMILFYMQHMTPRYFSRTLFLLFIETSVPLVGNAICGSSYRFNAILLEKDCGKSCLGKCCFQNPQEIKGLGTLRSFHHHYSRGWWGIYCLPSL